MNIVLDTVIVSLRKSYSQKVEELRMVLFELEHLQNEVIPELRRKYDLNFRTDEVTIQKLTLEVSEQQRTNELLLIKYQRGEEITQKVVEFVKMFVEKEYSRYKNNKKNSTFGLSESTSTITASKSQPSEELSRLYKDLVKKLHPDSNRNNVEQPPQYWHIVQESYEMKNLQKLRSFHTILCSEQLSPGMFTATESEKDRLTLEISLLNRKIVLELKRLDSLKSKEPFTFKDLIDSEQWQQQHTSSLQESIQTLQREIEQAKKVFLKLTKGITLKKDDKTILQQEKETFDEKFTNSTYFRSR